jgi:hypothetical protein
MSTVQKRGTEKIRGPDICSAMLRGNSIQFLECSEFDLTIRISHSPVCDCVSPAVPAPARLWSTGSDGSALPPVRASVVAAEKRFERIHQKHLDADSSVKICISISPRLVVIAPCNHTSRAHSLGAFPCTSAASRICCSSSGVSFVPMLRERATLPLRLACCYLVFRFVQA